MTHPKFIAMERVIGDSTVFLKQGNFAPPGDIRQYLKIFLIVTIGGMGITGIRWVESRDAAKHHTMQREILQQGVVQLTLSIVPTWKSPGLAKWQPNALLSLLKAFYSSKVS